jgi:hypothetical protein
MDVTDRESVAHEPSDVNVRAILLFIVGLIVVAAAIHVGTWLLFEFFARQTAAADPRPAPLAAPSGQLPPAPRLQRRPVNALKALRAEEDARLHEHAPGMPIEEAKRLIVERGLPARPK